MKNVNVYIKVKMKGLKGAGKAVALVTFVGSSTLEHKKMVSVSMENGTRDRLHLMIITKALHVLKEPCSVGVYINSRYISGAVEQGWVVKWHDENWKKKNGEEIKNADIWKLFYPLFEKHVLGIVKSNSIHDAELDNELEKENENGGK